MTRYAVWSTHVEFRPKPDRDAPKKAAKPDVPAHDELETVRTDRRVAEDDASLIKSCFHRKVWVNEVES